MRKVFLDSGFVIALKFANDQNHRLAVACWASLQSEFVRLLTTSFAFSEVAVFFKSRNRHDLAVVACDMLLSSSVVTLVHVDEELFDAGWQRLLDRPDKTYSLTDCISFVLMEREGVREALTFDEHFTQAGFVRLPG